jgi:hypothetical protein
MGAGTRYTTGARERILSCLRTAGEISDPGGLASAALAKAVDYPGSSVAFAQLLSSMERDGLIERVVRGKRTYRIGLAEGAGKPPSREVSFASPVLPASPGLPASTVLPASTGPAGDETPALSREPGPGTPATGPDERELRPGADAALDYDELAMRLLEQVVRRIAGAPDAGSPPPDALSVAWAAPASDPGPPGEDLALTLASLKRRLASIEFRQRELSEEAAVLREQLASAQRALAEVQAGAADRLDPAERQVLQRLLSSLNAAPARRRSAEAG